MLVGRDRELAEVGGDLAAVAAGEGRLVVVAGPAGIGKSRFVDTVAEVARARGLDVARGHAVDDPGAPALWPWLRLVRGWPGAGSLSPLEPGEPDAAARFARCEAVTDLLAARAATRPLLVVLDDLHWADPISLQLLAHAVRALRAAPVGLVVTSRDTPLPEVLAELATHDGARVLTLAGLAPGDVARWLPDLTEQPVTAADVAEVHARTGGNPLLIRMLAQGSVATGAGTTSETVLQRLAAARLAVLDEHARDVVEVAAVLGERLPEPLLAACVDRPVGDALERAQRAGVLRRGPDGFAFEHALVRDAVLAGLPPTRRRDLHRRVATALAATPGVPAGSVAAHWERAGGPDAAREGLRWAQRADDEARAVPDHEAALRFAELAGRRADALDLPEPERLDVMLRLAEARFLAGRIDASLETCRAVAEAATGHPDLLARAGLVVQGVGDAAVHRAVAAICERALAVLPASERALRARLTAQIAVGLAEAHGGTRPAELAATALAEADASGDPVAIVEALAARHLAISVPETVTERLELGRRAVQLGEAQRRTMPALWGHLWRADAALQLGNLAEFDHELGEIDRIATTGRSIVARWHHHRRLAARSALRGEFAAARDADAAADDLARRSGQVSLTGMTYAFRNQLAVLRGDPGEMPADWPAVVSAMPPMPLIQLTTPLQLALAGRIDEARAQFAPFRHLPAEFPHGIRWLPTLALIGIAATLLDDVESAGAVFDRLRDTAHHYSGDGSGGVFSSGANAGLLGELALTAGRIDDALGLFPDAVAMNLRIGARPYVARARLGWAQALLAGPAPTATDRATSATLLAEATDELQRLDMPGPLRTAVRLAAQTAPTSQASSPLSPREREVAELVGQSLSNRQIADRLVLSERTVETHVRNVLARLGFTRRTEIVTWVVAQRFTGAGGAPRSAGR